MGSAELSLARSQQGGTQRSDLGGVNDRWFSLPMHRLCSILVRSGGSWLVLGKTLDVQSWEQPQVGCQVGS